MMKRLQVLHIQRMSGVSGSEKYIADLAKSQSSAGYLVNVAIVCAASSKANLELYATDLQANGVPVYWFFSKSFLSIKLLKNIHKLIEKIRPSIVHTHLLHADIYATLVKRLFKNSFKIVSTKHGYQENFLAQHGFDVKAKPYNSIFYWLSRFVEANIDQSYAVSKAMAQFYYNLGITVNLIPFIHHGLTDAYLKMATKNRNKVAGQVSPSIVVVGRLVPYKGHVCLVHAFYEVLKEFPNVKLFIVGSGHSQRQLEELVSKLGIQKNVVFTGFQKEPRQFICEADVVVIPSFVEPFGLVFLEAFAECKPVVAFDVPAGNEIIKHTENGLLTPLKDSKAMAEAIVELLKNKAMADQLGKNGYALLTNLFTFSIVLGKVSNLYDQVLQE